jgi:thioredoxin-disulfide reductase
MTKHDLIIIGGGPAGLSAAIYASRRGLDTLVIAKSIGGQATYAPEIENYPGIDMISGGELSAKFYAQASKFGAKITSEEVTSITKDDLFTVKTTSGGYQAKTIILAFGKTPRDLGVKGESEFKGKGVSYCATCDSLFFKNKAVAVIGGGNSAIESAILLAKTSSKVYLVHRREAFTAEKTLIDQIEKDPKIELVYNSTVEEVKGDQVVSSIVLKNTASSKLSEIELQGIFVEVGFVVKSDFVEKLVDLDPKKQIIINSLNETKTAGLFAAGDVTTVPYKQIIIAAGEGAKSALAAYDYTMKIKGKTGVYSEKA